MVFSEVAKVCLVRVGVCIALGGVLLKICFSDVSLNSLTHSEYSESYSSCALQRFLSSASISANLYLVSASFQAACLFCITMGLSSASAFVLPLAFSRFLSCVRTVASSFSACCSDRSAICWLWEAKVAVVFILLDRRLWFALACSTC